MVGWRPLAGTEAEGVLVGDEIRIIGAWRPGIADRNAFTLSQKSLDELQELLRGASESVSLSAVTFAVPIEPLAQIFCAGFNYCAHCWLKPGNTVEVVVGGVGRLRNVVADEGAQD